MDREKVIKGIECCEIKGDCTGCPYDVEQGLPACKQLAIDALELSKEQEAEIRQLRLALDIVKGTCKGIKSGGGQFADMPTMKSAT